MQLLRSTNSAPVRRNGPNSFYSNLYDLSVRTDQWRTRTQNARRIMSLKFFRDYHNMNSFDRGFFLVFSFWNNWFFMDRAGQNRQAPRAAPHFDAITWCNGGSLAQQVISEKSNHKNTQRSSYDLFGARKDEKRIMNRTVSDVMCHGRMMS